MGIYDRPYYRDEDSRFAPRMPQSIVIRLILINVALWLVNGLFFQQNNWLTDTLAVSPDTLTRPWLWWQFLTYGFVHHWSAEHIVGNMIGLFFFGPEIEGLYGRREFLRLYLVLLVAGSVIWALVNRLTHAPPAPLVGASGAIVGVILLFCLNFPRRTILLLFVLPVPAWVLGVIVIGWNVMGALSGPEAGAVQTAFSVHLAGAALAFLYFHFRWNFGQLFQGAGDWLGVGRRSRFRVLRPPADEPPEDPDSDDLSQRVDQILEKIHREGEASLTRQERRLLETASREYQKRRRSGRT
jgi:membrane associated rhomboid family serine protease